MSKGFKKYLPVWLIVFALTISIMLIVPFQRDELFAIAFYFMLMRMARKKTVLSFTHLLVQLKDVCMLF